MRRFLTLIDTLPRTVLLLSTGVMLTLSGVLLALHASAVRAVQEVGLPAAVSVPALQKRLNILRAQIDVAELQQSIAEGSEDEAIATFVLPLRPNLDRTLAFFDLLRDRMQRDGLLRAMSPVETGKEEDDATVKGLRSTPFSFSVEVTEEGQRTLLSLLRFSGIVSVGDVLSQQETEQLLTMTEEENPAAVSVTENFLKTPLLSFAREPKAFKEQILRSFTSPTFEESFNDLLRHSDLPEVESLLGDAWGKLLEQSHLWPLRFLRLDRLTVKPMEGGWVKMDVRVEGYEQKA